MTTFGENNPPPAAGSGSRLGLGVVIGLVVAALVGVALYLTDVIRFGDDEGGAAGPDTTAITMPAEIGPYAPTIERTKERGATPEMVAAQEARYTKQSAATAAALSQAFDGAAAASQVYATADLMSLGFATVVRAESPGLFLPQVGDPADLGLAVNRENLETLGDVTCLTYYPQTYQAGTTPDRNELRVNLCQRTGPGLTVRFYGGGVAPEGTTDVLQFYVDVTNDLWDSMAGTTTAPATPATAMPDTSTSSTTAVTSSGG